MTIPASFAAHMRGTLLALAIFVLTAFTAPDAKKPVPVVKRSTPELPAAVKGKLMGTLIIEGPSVVTCGQQVTYTIQGCYCNFCILWYYNGTYTVTNDGSFTFTVKGSDNQIVTAVIHNDCTPSSAVINYGSKQFYSNGPCPIWW